MKHDWTENKKLVIQQIQSRLQSVKRNKSYQNTGSRIRKNYTLQVYSRIYTTAGSKSWIVNVTLFFREYEYMKRWKYSSTYVSEHIYNK